MQSEATAAVPVYRLYLLRALYLLIAVGQGALQWPKLLHHPASWDLWHGVGVCMLAALAAVSLLGIRYPLQMLPVLVFEFTWKTMWMLSVALPLWLSHSMDADIAENVFAIGLGVVLCPLMIPWGYLYENYFKRPGDRWK
jgi:hypothetical protein